MPFSATARNRLLLIALWIVFYASFTLFLPPLLDDADSVHAEVAREMIQRHDWVTLYANGIRYLEKAPVLYWSMAASFKLFGVSTAAARVPLALTVLALCLFLEAFARRAFGSHRAGLYAGLITLSSFGIFIFTRITIPDADVCLWLTMALLAFWRTEHAPVPVARRDHRTTVRLTMKLKRFASGVKPPVKATLLETDDPTDTNFDYESWDRTDSDSYLEHRPDPRHDAASPDRRGHERAAFEPQAPAASLLPCLVFAVACALNVLTKGLIGIVFPVATVALYLLLTRGFVGAWKRLGELHPIVSFVAFLVIAAPWHILIGLANPTQGHPGGVTYAGGHWQVPLPTDGNVHGWFWFYFVNEHLLRYLNLRVPRDYDTVPLALFWGLLLVWLMPWSAYLFHAVARVPLLASLKLRMRYAGTTRKPLTPLQSTELLLGLWAAIPLLFFSLSTRQEYYVLPAMPALILLLAGWLGQRAATKPEAERHRKSGARAAGALAALGAIGACVCIYFVLHTKAPAPDTDLSALLQQNPGDYALSFGHFLDLNAQALGMFRLPLILTAIAFGLLLPAAWVERMGKRVHSANLVTAAGAFLFLLAAHLGLQTFSPVLSSQRMAAAIAPQVRPNDLIILHGEYEAGSTLGFYLKRNDLHICEGRSSNLWYGSFFPDAPKIFETRESVAEKWAGPQRIFLWQDPSDKDRPVLSLHPTYIVAGSGGKQILSNQPNH
jgi:4-amino-4-deoxy-L-arabinose transferase-like glycosyltransferase